MAVDKPSVSESGLGLDLIELDEALEAISLTTTPARALRLVCGSVRQLGNAVGVSGFVIDAAGQVGLIDESQLPAPRRGALAYGELISDASARPRQAGIQRLRDHLGASDTQVLWLEIDKNRLGGLVIFIKSQDQSHKQVIHILAREAAQTLRRQTLAQQAKTSLAEALALQRISQAITRTLDFDKVADTLLSHTKKLFRVDAVSLFVASQGEEILSIYRAIGLSERYVATIRVDRNSATVAQLIKHHGPTQIYDATQGAVSGQAKVIKAEGIRSMLVAPIFSSRQFVGALVLYSKTPREFDYSELRFSQSLAEQAGIAFANANLHTDLVDVSSEIEQTRNLMRDGLIVLDRAGHVRYYNAAAGSLLGLTNRSTGRPLTEVFGQRLAISLEKTELTAAIEQALIGGLGRSSFQVGSTSIRYFEAVYSPYLNAAGSIVGVLINIRDITLLYLEKEKLQTIQSNIQDGLITIDGEGHTMECNNEWLRLFDVAESGSIVGQKFFEDISRRQDITFDQDLPSLVADVLKGKRLMCYAHFPATSRHIQISLGPLTTLGRPTGAVATARDITPLIEKTVEANEMTAKAQRHLRELSQLAELSSIVGFNVSSIYQKYLSKIGTLLESDSASIYLYNPGQQQLLRQQSLNPHDYDKPALELGAKHIVSQAFVSRRDAAADHSKTKYHHLATPIMHHSKTLGVVLVGRPNAAYSDHDAKLLQLVATRLAVLVENASLYHDVNARRERWEAVFRFTDEGIIIFDRQGIIVGFNPASTEITQWSAAEAIGLPFERIVKTVTLETSAPSAPPLSRVLGDGITIAKSEQLIETRVGGRLWTEISYSPIFDDAGKVTSGIAIIRNTQKDREVEEIKSDFISIVSHELRTPLTAIKGFLSMVLKQDFGELADKQQHYLSRVYQSNQRMIDLVEDLLDVSYIESGKINLSINPVAMENVLNEVTSELAGKGAANQILIKVKRSKRLPLVLADETRLHQILLNLVDNAIKYSMPGTQVEVDFQIQGDELVTTVSDHGVGISKGQLDRLFTKFGRIYNPMSVQAGGTGLGLYIVKNLVESHNGRIWATSQEGRGSKFRFTLPIAKQLPLIG